MVASIEITMIDIVLHALKTFTTWPTILVNIFIFEKLELKPDLLIESITKLIVRPVDELIVGVK